MLICVNQLSNQPNPSLRARRQRRQRQVLEDTAFETSLSQMGAFIFDAKSAETKAVAFLISSRAVGRIETVGIFTRRTSAF